MAAPMRRYAPLVVLLLAACSTTPRPVPGPAPAPVAPNLPPVRTGLTGLNQAELTARFGVPSLQVREGTAVKLQWQNAGCVLDTYLYPPASGAGLATVTHVDARRPGSGDSVPVEGCVASLTR
jgi:outer membrane biogenesis lipoprotein LolB